MSTKQRAKTKSPKPPSLRGGEIKTAHYRKSGSGSVSEKRTSQELCGSKLSFNGNTTSKNAVQSAMAFFGFSRL